MMQAVSDFFTPSTITLIILGVAAILFFTELFPLPVTAMLVPIALTLTGCIEPAEAFKNFGNKFVILFLAMFIVGEAVFRTGLAHMIGKFTVKIAGTNKTLLLVLIMLVAGVMSAVLSNTGTTVVFIPIVLGICTSAGIHAGKILMPMAFAASLGGTMTLVGTPPNGVVNSDLEKAGLESFGFFEFGKIGILLFVAGIIYYALIGKKFLPNTGKSSQESNNTQEEMKFRTKKMPAAIVIFAGVIVVMAVGKYINNPLMKTTGIPLEVVAMLGACLVIMTKCITMEEAFKSVSWTTIFLFAGMLAMSTAMTKTGAAKNVADIVVANIENPRVLLAVTFLITAVATNFMSNTATTAIMAPIGISIAAGFGVSPLPIVMGVAMAASCCFMTPIATPPNTIVLGPGKYRFIDYLKAGWPLQIITFIIAIIFIPIFWPFNP